MLEVVNAFEDVSDLKLNFTFTERRTGNIISAYADTTKANTVLGWKSELTLKGCFTFCLGVGEKD